MISLYNCLAQTSVYKLHVGLRLNRVLYNLFFHRPLPVRCDCNVSKKAPSLCLLIAWSFQIKSVVSCLFFYFWTTQVYQDLWFFVYFVLSFSPLVAYCMVLVTFIYLPPPPSFPFYSPYIIYIFQRIMESFNYLLTVILMNCQTSRCLAISASFCPWLIKF